MMNKFFYFLIFFGLYQLPPLQVQQVQAQMNYREFPIKLWGQQIVFAGMSHPAHWQGEAQGQGRGQQQSVSILQEKGITHLMSFEVKELESLKQLLAAGSGIEHMELAVADYTAPTLAQIYEFLHYIKLESEKKLKQKTTAKFGLHCMGGKGRTGTFLAALELVSYTQAKRGKKQQERLIPFNAIAEKTEILVPDLVVKAIREVRKKDIEGRSIETVSQVQILSDLYQLLKQNRAQDFSSLPLLEEKAHVPLTAATTK